MPTAADLRDDVATLARLADADLDGLWRQVSTADQARDALLEVLPGLVGSYQLAAGTIAADWYDEVRAEAGVSRRFLAFTPDPGAAGAAGADVLARWGVDPLYRAEPDWDRARTLIGGGLQLRIANVARSTVTGSSVADPSSRGWQRRTSGESCGFCIMLSSRGAVYSESTVDFAAHDDCDCYAVPAFDGRPRPVKPFTPSSRRVSDADRARARAFIARTNAG